MHNLSKALANFPGSNHSYRRAVEVKPQQALQLSFSYLKYFSKPGLSFSAATYIKKLNRNAHLNKLGVNSCPFRNGIFKDPDIWYLASNVEVKHRSGSDTFKLATGKRDFEFTASSPVLSRTYRALVTACQAV